MFNTEKIDAILERAAYYAWCDEWCSHNERLYDQSNAAHVNLAGARIEDYAPETPADSWLDEWNRDPYGGGFKLRAFLSDLLRKLGSPQPTEAAEELVSLLRSGTPAKGRAFYGLPSCRALLDIDDTASLGYYLVMEALGHGVSMGDDGGPSWHDIGRVLGSELPSIDAPSWFGEPGEDDHEHGAWSWVDGASETEIRGCLDALGFETSGDGADRRGLMALMRDGDVALDDVAAYFDGLYPGSET